MDSGVPRTSRQRRGALLLFTASLLTSGTLGRLPTSAPARLTVHGSVRESSGSPVPGAQILRVASQVVQSCPDLFLGSRANLWLAAG
ncbi:MAG: hypothetical protein DMH00_13490, partial [Acidobacteria bacterium]